MKLAATISPTLLEHEWSKTSNLYALGAPKTDRPSSSFGSCAGPYTIIHKFGDHSSNDPGRQSAPDNRKWSFVITDKSILANKIDDVQGRAISEELNRETSTIDKR
jgi:hypothetical protein